VGGLDPAFIQNITNLHEDIWASITMRFVPKQEERRERHSYAEVQLYRQFANHELEVLTDKYTYDGGFSHGFGPTRDGRYKYSFTLFFTDVHGGPCSKNHNPM
jgi:hypothetical protein